MNAMHPVPEFPSPDELQTVSILGALAQANRALAELKGRAAAVPNPGILLNTLSLQEAMASSEIENIVTTQDELFRAMAMSEVRGAPAAKEVENYNEALKLGYESMTQSQGIISNNALIDMFRLLKGATEGFRVTPGTVLKNQATGETVHVPPQSATEIVELMTALERFVNDDASNVIDPLIKMALIHHRFESIHPFSDCNGRVGRILNVLYLTRTGLLDTPILYLSRHLIRNKNSYYRLLQKVRKDRDWESWVVFMLRAVAVTSVTTLRLVEGIRQQMAGVKRKMREELPNLYSQDLLNNLFRHPYTRIEFVMNDLRVSRPTAARYLNTLADHDFVSKRRHGRNNYFVSENLIGLFLAAAADPVDARGVEDQDRGGLL